MSNDPPPDLRDIEDATVTLWRYLDIYKYLDLIQTSELHFARADEMEDPWEGSVGAANHKLRPQLYGEHWEAMSRGIGPVLAATRSRTYLNCWHIGAHESMAMWRLYGSEGKRCGHQVDRGRSLRCSR